jgi:NAD+ synthase (glutamine-hydrolysing)
MSDELLKVALAQIDTTVGDLEGNAAKVRDGIARARDEGAQLVVFPELTLTGYPPEDLLLKTHFLDAAESTLHALAADVEGIVALVGYPERADDVYNSAAVLADGGVQAIYRKVYLPNYSVFDEARYFQSGTEGGLIELNGIPIGLTICEDIWEPGPPATDEALAGARVVVNLSASPYHAGKGITREAMLIQRARDSNVAVLFCNLVGGQDELVFDGHSVAIDVDGEVLARAPQFEEAMVFCTLDPSAIFARRLQDARHRPAVRRGSGLNVPTLAQLQVPRSDAREVGGSVAEVLGPEEELYRALVLGVRDYVQKNGFERVVVALSGGIDSALVALVAVDALGADRVTFVSMPSPYSSEGTKADARAIAENLGSPFLELGIEEAMRGFDELLAPAFNGAKPDITEENLQARIRGNVVMALSNKFGWLVLTTGNKSEMSVGYATLYGDMAGGFAVLKDVFKNDVYKLTRWRNEKEGRELVPSSVLDRAPSAELRYEQRDEDSLPPYDVLDPILEAYVEQDLDAEEIVRQGFSRDDVDKVIRLVDLAEYKRRQAAPGVRVSTKAFGRDRRLPITNRFRGS